MSNTIDLPYVPTGWTRTNDKNYVMVENTTDLNHHSLLINIAENKYYEMRTKNICMLPENYDLNFPDDKFNGLHDLCGNACLLFSMIDSNTFFSLETFYQVNRINKNIARIEFIFGHSDIKYHMSRIKCALLKMNLCHKNCVRHDNNQCCVDDKDNIIGKMSINIKKLLGKNTYVIYNGDYECKENTTCIFDIQDIKIKIFHNYYPEPSFMKYMDKISKFVMVNHLINKIKIFDYETGYVDTYDHCDLSTNSFLRNIEIESRTSIFKFYSENTDDTLKITANDGLNIYEQIVTPIDATDNFIDVVRLVREAFRIYCRRQVYLDYIVDNDSVKLTIGYNTVIKYYKLNFDLKKIN